MTSTPLSRSTVAEDTSAWYAGASDERLQLFSPWGIIGFGAVVCIALTLSYPVNFLKERLNSSQGQQANPLTAEYLRVFLEADPEAHNLRANLVRQFIKLGALSEARAALPALRSAGDRWDLEADWFELEIRELEALAQAVGSSRRIALMGEVNSQIRRLLERNAHEQQVLWLAHKALAMEEPETALLAMQRLASNAATLSAQQYEQAARIVLGLNDHRTSAALYFHAMEQALAFAERRSYFMQGLRSLQGGSLHQEAVAAIDQHIGPLIYDRDTLLFVIRLARSADRLDIAQRYVVQLLKLSIALQREEAVPMPVQLSLGASKLATYNFRPAALPRSASANASYFVRPVSLQEPASSTAMPMVPFDEEIYTLSYEVFLANGNLADAKLVAEWAVRQQLKSAVWRLRLAQVNEWSHAPQEALPQWLAYARMTGDKAAWERVLSLAEGLYDSQTALAALEQKVASEPDNQKLFERLLTTYEYIGEPERALEALHRHIDGKARTSAPQRQKNLTLFAGLAERMGRDEDALDAWQRLQKEFGPRSDYALHIAVLLNRKGKAHEAYEELEQATPVAALKEGEFWSAYSELARLLQKNDKAIAGYQRLLQADTLEPNDLFNLIALLEGDQPLVAARVAQFGFNVTGDARFVQLALNNNLRAGDYETALQFVRSPRVRQTSALQRDPLFLSMRATLMQQLGQLQEAGRDLRAALALHPTNSSYRAGLIWILIAQRDTPSLKRVLSQWAGEAEDDPSLWGPYAAAHMALNRQRDALHWFRKSGLMRDDYLWLMSYAEALEANSQPDMAWRLRRHALLELRRPDLLHNKDPEQMKAMRERLASLAPLFAGGDEASAIIQALLHDDVAAWVSTPEMAEPRTGSDLAALIEDRASPVAGNGKRPEHDIYLSASAREVALAYAMSREAHELARAWLATRFARQLATPVWADLSLALAADDRAKLMQLLDDLPDWLPMYDRIEAAQRTGQYGLAQTLAFDQMEHLPYDEQLHARFTTLVANAPPAFTANVTRSRQWPLSRTELRAELVTDLTQRLKLGFGLSDAKQTISNIAELRVVPANDQTIEAALQLLLPDGTLTAALQQRYADRTVTGFQLSYALDAPAGMDLTAGIGIRQPASESALLRVGAMRSGVTTSLTYALGKTEYLRAGFGWQRYATQAGTDLGSGSSWNLEAGTHLRVEYPNLTLRAYVSDVSFASSGQSDAQIARLLPANADAGQLLGQGNSMIGLSLGVGNVVDGRYTRTWRPFADLGISYSNQGGRGLNLSGGVAGSVFGSDTFQLRFTRSAGTPASPNGYREFGVNYIWLY